MKSGFANCNKMFDRLFLNFLARLAYYDNMNISQVSVQVSSVQSLSQVWLFATPWIAASQASLSITNSQSLLKLMSMELVMPSSHLILCHPLLLLPPIFPSIRVFSNESTLCIRWPKYWSFSFNISPSSEHPGLISCRMDFLDLLAVQGTLKSLLQHHSSKASILLRSAFFTVQLSHPYMISCRFRIRYIAFSSVKVMTNALALEKCIRFFFYNEVLWYHYCSSSVVYSCSVVSDSLQPHGL